MSVIKKLFYKIGDFALDIPEWRFPDKGITILTGVSGSGKSTVLKILCGLLPCPSLVWEFKGQNLAKLSPSERKIGMCFQDLRLFPHWTARENILFALKAQGLFLKEKKKDFEEIIDFLDLKKSIDLSINHLSGGEKQRTALARALIVCPKILFLDEPFSYLDKKARKKARHLTFEIIKKYSAPLLLVSHDQEDIKDLTDESFYLDRGKIYKI